ncbi:Sugar transport protein MST3 like [Verticillium longisporum]|uniref:Sugar transport protein MST3 like n=1 Tax=Verticillium longisporum TaxID=100787 RepID=A0A8I2ZU94_VERLO|nr:Sugar transport protein MST3 like [Verticillium longisporum]
MIGIFVAAYSAGFASDILGRRLVIYIGCVLCIVGVVVQSFAESAMTIFGGKLVSTLGFGLGHVLAPVFVAEIAPDELRGICLTLINTMIVLGQWGCALVAYGGSFIASDWGWRMPFLTQLVPPVLMLALAVPLLPESPSWLLLKGRREESGKSLEKFHGADLDVEAKLAVLEAAIEQEHSVSQDKASYLDCFKGSNKRRTTIIVMAYLA